MYHWQRFATGSRAAASHRRQRCDCSKCWTPNRKLSVEWRERLFEPMSELPHSMVSPDKETANSGAFLRRHTRLLLCLVFLGSFLVSGSLLTKEPGYRVGIYCISAVIVSLFMMSSDRVVRVLAIAFVIAFIIAIYVDHTNSMKKLERVKGRLIELTGRPWSPMDD